MVQLIVFDSLASGRGVEDYAEGARLEGFGHDTRPGDFQRGFEGGDVRVEVGFLFFGVGVEEYGG